MRTVNVYWWCGVVFCNHTSPGSPLASNLRRTVRGGFLRMAGRCILSSSNPMLCNHTKCRNIRQWNHIHTNLLSCFACRGFGCFALNQKRHISDPSQTNERLNAHHHLSRHLPLPLVGIALALPMDRRAVPLQDHASPAP